MPFLIGVPLEPNLYLEPFSRYLHPNISGSRLDLSRSRDVISHVTNRSAICHFLLVSHWNRTSISNRFRDIRPQNQCAHTHIHTPKTRTIHWIGLCSVLRPLQHSIGYMGDTFYRSKDPTNSIKVLKEDLQKTKQATKTTKYT